MCNGTKKSVYVPLILSIFLLSCSAQASQCMFMLSSTVVNSLTWIYWQKQQSYYYDKIERHCYLSILISNTCWYYICKSSEGYAALDLWTNNLRHWFTLSFRQWRQNFSSSLDLLHNFVTHCLGFHYPLYGYLVLSHVYNYSLHTCQQASILMIEMKWIRTCFLLCNIFFSTFLSIYI